jgi:biopolymer transport protein ExbB
MKYARLIGIALLLGAATAYARETADSGGILVGENLFDLFKKGGVLMWPILLCSVVAFAFVLERLVCLRSSAVFPRALRDEVKELVGDDRIDEAVSVCGADRSSFANILHACLIRADGAGFEMEEALEEVGSRVLYDLRRNARPLGVVADVAPLLGLMGTVVGMIKAFEVVAKTGALGRTELLAEGIGEALITTAFGLSVAIPALIFYQYFRGKADGLVRTMEDACLQILWEVRNHRKV